MDRKWTMNEMDRVTRCSFNPAVNKRTVWLPLWKGGGGTMIVPYVLVIGWGHGKSGAIRRKTVKVRGRARLAYNGKSVDAWNWPACGCLSVCLPTGQAGLIHSHSTSFTHI